MPKSAAVSDELRYRILRLVDESPNLSQRELADALGVSVGKVNYCLRALVTKGLVKIRRFTNSRRKSAYLYVLTPNGVSEKLQVAYRFLEIKRREYEALTREIELLTRGAGESAVRDALQHGERQAEG